MVLNDDSLSHLMAQSQDGDRDAYRALLQHCERWLRRYFSGRIAPCDVDDLVQETLVSLHRKRSTYDSQRPFSPWLAAIARYRWIDKLRKTYRANETELFDEHQIGSSEDSIGATITLTKLLGLIPPKQANAIQLVKIDGLSIAEAALRTGQSETLVKVNIHRGFKKLQALCDVS